MEMSGVLSVHPVGLNAECKKILSVTLNVLTAGGCGVELAEQMTGETVVVVDLDSDEGRAFYERDRRSHRAVVIASEENSLRAEALIRKPLRVQALRNMLSDLLEQSPEGSGNSLNEVAAAPVTKSGGAVLPNSTLFYAMVNAVSAGLLLKVTAEGLAGAVLIHGPTRVLYTTMERSQLVQLAGMEGSALRVSPLEEFDFMKEARGVTSHRVERMLWLADEKGTRGVAPAIAGEKTVFRLNQWPRFDVKSVNPAYLSLAALMTRNTLSCSAAARMAGVPLETVFNFYHAAKVCGVLDSTVIQEPHQEELPVEPIKRSSLVSRIAKKLGINLV